MEITEMFKGLTKVVALDCPETRDWLRQQEFEHKDLLYRAISHRVERIVGGQVEVQEVLTTWIVNRALIDLDLIKTEDYDPEHPKTMLTPEEKLDNLLKEKKITDAQHKEEKAKGLWRWVDNDLIIRSKQYGGTCMISLYVRPKQFLSNITDVTVREQVSEETPDGDADQEGATELTPEVVIEE